ncbi:MAG: tetratricopeptide repeat protein [Candidatus Cloacimonetes bacterium]|nr:tetratricopeptide repeat protein [Candidatus Cloacimonadota bacterium]
MRQFSLLLLAFILLLSACVGNKSFQAQKSKVQVIEARQNNQDAELEMARKDIIQNKKKLDELVIRLKGVDEQLLVLDPMQDEIVKSATAIVELQDDLTALGRQLDEAIATNTRLEQKLTALTKDTNDTFDAYSDYLIKMKDAQTGFATKAELTRIADESSQMAAVLDDLTSELEAISGYVDEQDGILMSLEETVEGEKSAAEEQMELRDEIVRIRKDLTDHQGELADIRQTLDGEVKTDMNALRERVYTVDSDLKALTSDLQQVIVKERAAADKRRQAALNTQYKAALNEHYKGNFEHSIILFEEFLKNNPGSDLSANASYWIGENYYSAGNYAKALREFQSVADRYPEHAKAWDAQLKIGLTYYQLQDLESCRTELMKIKTMYPDYPQMKVVDRYLNKL